MSNQIKAVLVKLGVRIFPNTRQDPVITDEVRARKSLGVGAGKWVKHIFPEEALKEIRETGGEARRRHYDLTLPWEEGYRLLPSGAHREYEREMDGYKAAFAGRVSNFQEAYDHWIEKAKEMHNGTFDASLYPDWIVMKKYFGFSAEFSPVPKAAHFITAGIARKAVSDMREDLERRNNERVQAAVRDTWTRLMIPVKALAEKLSERDGIFRDSLIENVKSITALIPQLNLTGDQDLARMAQEIEARFANIDPQLLRTDLAVRQSVSAEASQLVKHFGQIGKRRFA